MQFKTKDTGLLLRMTFEWNEKILLDKVQSLLIMPF
jgi:hypothetical protein